MVYLIESGFFPVNISNIYFLNFFITTIRVVMVACSISLLWYQVVGCIRAHTDLQSMKKCKENQLDTINMCNKA